MQKRAKPFPPFDAVFNPVFSRMLRCLRIISSRL
jgi:hypothetical protein